MRKSKKKKNLNKFSVLVERQNVQVNERTFEQTNKQTKAQIFVYISATFAASFSTTRNMLTYFSAFTGLMGYRIYA